MIWTRTVLFLVSLLSTLGRAAIYQTRFDGVTWDDDNWRLQTTRPLPLRYQSRASLANGYIGISLASLGPFFEIDEPVNGDNINGWPLFDRRQAFATVAGFYDVQPTTNGTNFEWLNQYGGESVISGIPHWSSLVLESNGHILNASTDVSQITGFSSTLDMGAGLLTWRYTWTPPRAVALDIEYSMFVHKLNINTAVVRLKVTSSRDTNITVTDVLDGDCAVRTYFKDKHFYTSSPTIWTSVQPQNIVNVTAYVYSTLSADPSIDLDSRKQVTDDATYFGANVSTIAQVVDVCLKAGQTSVIDKFVGIASTDAFNDPQSIAHKASLSAAASGYVELLGTHIDEWQSILTPDSVDRYNNPDGSLPDDSDIIVQNVLAVSNPFALLQNVVGPNAIAQTKSDRRLDVNSISVGGLASGSYAGLIFWDADVWMSPGLLVTFPQAAAQIANYRSEKYSQALQNVKGAFASSQANTQFAKNAAAYPWTSGRFGNCTGTGPCFDYEYHLNGDIALELMNYLSVTGDANLFQQDYLPILDSVTQLYSDLLSLNRASGLYELHNATDPDEYANHVDDPGYTMVLIKVLLERTNELRHLFNMSTIDIWDEQAPKIDIPVDDENGIILEYIGMNGSISVKQADVILIDDFLNYQNPYTLADLDFYAGRQSSSGPAMTYGVFSIIASAASPSGCSSYTYDLYGSQPYERAPWFQFSEQLLDDFEANQGTHPAYPFLTGMGGAHRVAVFGYLGLRLQWDSLNVNPSLPPQIPYLKYRTIYWQGHAINATANATHTIISRLPKSLPSANPDYTNDAIPVTIGFNTTVLQLPPNSSLTLPNRTPGLILTVPGNLAQCRPLISSNTDFVPGQFPLSAIDGASSTKWQPTTSAPASITVSLGDAGIVPIAGFAFDWAQSPPRAFSITFSNVSSPSPTDTRNATIDTPVSISDPFDSTAANIIRPYLGNTTNLTLATPVWGGRFATLTIRGNWADVDETGAGASVAEWAIVAQGEKPAMRTYHSSTDSINRKSRWAGPS